MSMLLCSFVHLFTRTVVRVQSTVFLDPSLSQPPSLRHWGARQFSGQHVCLPALWSQVRLHIETELNNCHESQVDQVYIRYHVKYQRVVGDLPDNVYNTLRAQIILQHYGCQHHIPPHLKAWKESHLLLYTTLASVALYCSFKMLFIKEGSEPPGELLERQGYKE